jgi:hypothetical protein
MDLLEFLVIAGTAAAICLRQAWISILQDCETPTTARRQRPHHRPRPADAIPNPANDTWSARKAA